MSAPSQRALTRRSPASFAFLALSFALWLTLIGKGQCFFFGIALQCQRGRKTKQNRLYRNESTDDRDSTLLYSTFFKLIFVNSQVAPIRFADCLYRQDT